MTESWDDYLAEGTTDSAELQDLSYDLGDQAAAADTPQPAVPDLQGAAWSDDAAAEFAQDAESWDAYGDRAAGEATTHLENAARAAESGDDVTAAWEAQQAGFSAETADHAYGQAEASDDISLSYSDAADTAVAEAADAGWDPGATNEVVADSWSTDTSVADTSAYDTAAYDTTTYDSTAYDTAADTDIV